MNSHFILVSILIFTSKLYFQVVGLPDGLPLTLSKISKSIRQKIFFSVELPIFICFAKGEQAEVSADWGLYVDVSVNLYNEISLGGCVSKSTTMRLLKDYIRGLPMCKKIRNQTFLLNICVNYSLPWYNP